MLEGLPRNHFGAILADPPWRSVSAEVHYRTMLASDIAALPVGELAAADCSLFLWTT